MRKIFIILLLSLCVFNIYSQVGVVYNPDIQPERMQYFKPVGNQFVGDCIPFWHDGTYYLYWLLDEDHHSMLNGLGAHQWVLSTSTDLVKWEHHPVVLGIDEDWEKSICTGSVVFHKGKFYAFYATRLIDDNGHVNEQLSYAVSDDGINFEKHKPNPFYTSAQGYSKQHFRDPKVIVDENGIFHLFVSSEEEDFKIANGRGCLVHMWSTDLEEWTVGEPILSGVVHVPECPDYFFWNGWYYLIYGQAGATCYVKSREPYGPWEYPPTQALLEPSNNVVKTAEFANGRRIAAGWTPSRSEGRDDGWKMFGGNVIMREVLQLSNGDLATRYAPELIPPMSKALKQKPEAIKNAKVRSNGSIAINAQGAIGGVRFEGVPYNCRIIMDVELEGRCEDYGLFLRAQDRAQDGYKLSLSPATETVELHNVSLRGVGGLESKITLEIVMMDDIIDVCIDGRRCLVNRLLERKGEYLWIYARQGTVSFENVKIFPIVAQ